MENQEQVKKLHELINDVFSDIVEVKVSDDDSRKRREKAIFGVIGLRRHVDDMGLRHDLTTQGGTHGDQG